MTSRGCVPESLGTQAPAAYAGIVSCSGGRPTTCAPHALGGAQCGEQRRPDLKHIKLTEISANKEKKQNG